MAAGSQGSSQEPIEAARPAGRFPRGRRADPGRLQVVPGHGPPFRRSPIRGVRKHLLLGLASAHGCSLEDGWPGDEWEPWVHDRFHGMPMVAPLRYHAHARRFQSRLASAGFPAPVPGLSGPVAEARSRSLCPLLGRSADSAEGPVLAAPWPMRTGLSGGVVGTGRCLWDYHGGRRPWRPAAAGIKQGELGGARRCWGGWPGRPAGMDRRVDHVTAVPSTPLHASCAASTSARRRTADRERNRSVL